MSSDGQAPRAVVSVKEGGMQSGLIIVPFSEDGLSSLVWGKMMERLLAGERNKDRSGIVITGKQDVADRVQLVESLHGHGSEVRLLPPSRPQEEADEEWVSIHIPLGRLEGMVLLADRGHKPGRGWLGPALASTIVLSGLVLGAAGAKTFPSVPPGATATAAAARTRPAPLRPSVVVVEKKQPETKSVQPVDSRDTTVVKPQRRRRAGRLLPSVHVKQRKVRRWRARRHVRVARYALRKGRTVVAKRRAVLALRLDPTNRAARWILARARTQPPRTQPPSPSKPPAPRFIGDRRGDQPVVW
jgi:hypothetical protein